MIAKNRLVLIVLILLIFSYASNAQSIFKPAHVGVYHSGISGQVAIGTDIERLYFGDIRFSANDLLESLFGIELSVNRNLYTDEWFNFHMGLMAGYFFYDEVRAGLPLGFTIKPFENHRAFAFLLEATPNYFIDAGYLNLRANLGIRYSFIK